MHNLLSQLNLHAYLNHIVFKEFLMRKILALNNYFYQSDLLPLKFQLTVRDQKIYLIRSSPKLIY